MYDSRYIFLSFVLLSYFGFIKESPNSLETIDEIIFNHQMDKYNENYTRKEINKFLESKRK